MAVSDPAHDCWTCKHRKVEEHGPGIAAGIRVHKCRKFISSATGPMLCGNAYDEFCGGGDYQPTLLTKIVRFFAG